MLFAEPLRTLQSSVALSTRSTWRMTRNLTPLTSQILAAGNKIAEAERAEMIRKGIIDEHADLLNTELLEDMRKDAGRDGSGVRWRTRTESVLEE
jgi:hypothetical protein